MTKENFRKTAVRNNMRETGQTYTQAAEELRENDTHVKPDLKLLKKPSPTFDNIITNAGERTYLLETIFEPYQQQDVYSDYTDLPDDEKPTSSNPVILVMGDVESGKTLFIQEYIKKLSETRPVGYLPEPKVHEKQPIETNFSEGPNKNPNLHVFSAEFPSLHYPRECLTRSHQLGLEAIGMDITITHNPHEPAKKFFNETMSDPDRTFLFVGGMRVNSEYSKKKMLEKIKKQYDEYLQNPVDLNKDNLFSRTLFDIQVAKTSNLTFEKYASQYLEWVLLDNFPHLRAYSSIRPKVNAIIFLTRTNKITGPEFDHELIVL